jgi:hypothetical protein
VIKSLLYCVPLFVAVLAFGDDDSATVADLPTLMKAEDLWQPVLPPTTSEGADALDRQVYSQFTSDDEHLENEPGSSKSYALLPHGALAGYYDDNITLSPTHRQSDLALAAEPGLGIGLGDFRAGENNYLVADYTGRWTSYLDHSAADSYEQFATVRAQLRLAKWTFHTNFRVLDLDDVDVDSGARTSRHIFDTVQVASCELSEKSSLELQGQNVIRDYQNGPESVEWQGRGLYNYQWDPKLSLGGGFAGGVLSVDGYSSQTYEQALLRVLYDPTAKISIQDQVGVELRQLGNGQDRITPVLDLACDYQPRLGTDIRLDGYSRTFSSSSAGDEDYTATGMSLAVRQDVGASWRLTLTGGYENNSYFYTDMSAASPRDDGFFYINPSVQLRINDYSKIELFYNHRENDSNNSSRDFADNQIGIRASLTY